MLVDDQVAIDKMLIELDGTANKSKLGANAMLSVSPVASGTESTTENDRQQYSPASKESR